MPQYYFARSYSVHIVVMESTFSSCKLSLAVVKTAQYRDDDRRRCEWEYERQRKQSLIQEQVG